MSWQILVYLISLLVTWALSTSLAAYAWRHRATVGARSYTILAAAESLLVVVELASVFSLSLPWASFWFRMRYPLFALIAVAWVVFALEYSGHQGWLSRGSLAGLLLIPLVTQALLWTNQLHGLWTRQEPSMARQGSLWLADVSTRIPAIGYLVHSFYAMMLTLIGVALLLITAWKLRETLLGQAILLTSAGVVALFFAVNSIFGLLPRLEFNPLTPGLGLSVLLVGLAVFRFEFLKRAPTPAHLSALAKLHITQQQTLMLFILIFLILASGLSAGAYLSYVNYKTQFRERVNEQLLAIVALKAAGLQAWYTERLSDGEALQHSPALAALVQAYFANPTDTQTQGQLQTWLDSIRQAYGYERVFLLDVEGQERLASPNTSEPVVAHLIQDAPAALATGQVTFLDFHRNTERGSIHLAVLVPLYIEADIHRPLAVLVLRIDPHSYLYPYLQQWPGVSQTAETLLVRREGDAALFLNPLRFRPDAALNLRIPFSQTEVLAVKAVQGQTGVAQGMDYRGHAVVGALQPVQGMPWFLVARMDADEVYAPLRQRLWETLAFFGALLLASGASLGLLWRQQETRHYRQQIEAAKALQQAEARYRALVEQIPAIVYTDSAEHIGHTLYISPQLEAILGYTPQEWMDNDNLWLDIMHPDDRLRVQAQYILSSQNGEPFTAEYRLTARNGQEVWVRDTAVLIREASTPLFWQGILFNITERKHVEQAMQAYSERLEDMVNERTAQLQEAQEQLVRRERLAMLGQLAGSIGHELRNPLGVIANAVYYLKMIQPEASQTVKDYLDLIESEIRGSDKIVSDLLDFTRIKSLDRQAVPVSELVTRTLERYPPPSGVQVAVEIPPSLPLVYADPRHVEQILGNLITNAYQAMPEGGQLSLSARSETHTIALAVTDTGVGIPAEALPQIFEPLFTTKPRGIGLGLAVSRKLAEANHGSIEVQSQPGKGSTFTLYLPSGASPHEHHPEAPS